MLYYKKNIFVLAAAASIGIFSSCDKPEEVTPEHKHEISVPATYSFQSLLLPDKSSVSYSGQVVRQLLIMDIKNVISAHAAGTKTYTKQDVLDRFVHVDSKNLPILTSPGAGLTPLASRYIDISTGKSLKDKSSAQTLKGYDMKPADLVTAWIDKLDFSKTGPAVYVDPVTYVDYSELIAKALSGAVSYYQATTTYLADDKLFNADNTKAAETGAAFTAMEHYWDEAFGYFGASKEYASFSDTDLAGTKLAKDSNGDGKIDFTSEYNFGLSSNAAKRDLGGAKDTDFTKQIFDAFLAGRTAIVNKKSVADIIPHRDAAVRGMEKTISATVVHYLNDALTDLAYLGNAAKHPKYVAAWGTGAEAEQNLKYRLAKNWSELKGFALALEMGNPKTSMIQAADLAFVQEKIGTQPVVSEASAQASINYVNGLKSCKDKLKTVYGFSEAAMASW